MKSFVYILIGILFCMQVSECPAQTSPGKQKQEIVLHGTGTAFQQDVSVQLNRILNARLKTLEIGTFTVLTQNASGTVQICYSGKADSSIITKVAAAPGSLRIFSTGDPAPEVNSLFDSAKALPGSLFSREEIVKEAHANLKDPRFPALDITLKEPFVGAFEKFSKENEGKIVVLVLDGRVIFAPHMNGPITSGKLSLTGNGMTPGECRKLAAILCAGPLPIPLE
jgi:preprotein translocase subunit SecD